MEPREQTLFVEAKLPSTKKEFWRLWKSLVCHPGFCVAEVVISLEATPKVLFVGRRRSSRNGRP
jgi:hypothetical protein